MSTAARSPSAIRLAPAAHDWSARWFARWPIGMRSTAWPRCGSGSGRASRRSGRGYKEISEREPQAVRWMFDRIARRYALVNTVLSAGTDGGWRRRAAKATGLTAGGSALDVACGSGKLTAQLARIAGPNGRVVGLDFSTQMLEVARAEFPGIEFREGDALNLPFEDATFDASTIAFGLRNLADPVVGLREMLRVV